MIDYTGCGGESTKSKNRSNKEDKAVEEASLSADVVRGMKEGDHRSFEIVFHAFYYRVRNFISSLTKDMDTAEELAQEVFVTLWENRGKVDPSRNFNSYIYVLAKNAALSHFRTASLHRKIEKQVFTDEPVGNVESEILARETQLLIKLTVGNMPRQRKMIYELSQVQNKTNNEIAEELNITKKAVEKHLRLAITDIRSVLQKFISLMLF